MKTYAPFACCEDGYVYAMPLEGESAVQYCLRARNEAPDDCLPPLALLHKTWKFFESIREEEENP
jgi:hypothetical protein